MKEGGYTDSKPFIDVNGKTMIEHVVEMMNYSSATFHFIMQLSDYRYYDVHEILSPLVKNYHIHTIDGTTEGAACTVLTLRDKISRNDPVMIVNSDQIIKWGENPFKNLVFVDGCIYCFKGSGPKWSYARKEGPRVVEVAEKKQISDDATAGAYFWKWWGDFVDAADRMIEKDIRVNGEFYVAPVYNEALDKFIITRDVDKVVHLGTPEELEEFVNGPN